MRLTFQTESAWFTCERQWGKPIFMVRMGPRPNRFHLVDNESVGQGTYGRIYKSLCGSESGDWRAVQYGDLPFGQLFCTSCGRIGALRGLIAKVESAVK